MIHCQYELTWNILQQEQKGYSISRNLKIERVKRNIFRLLLLILWFEIIILLITFKSIIGALLLILYILYVVFSKFIIKHKFNKRKNSQDGEWIVKLWIDDKVVLQNIKGKGETSIIPFSEIREYGSVQEACYFVTDKNMIWIPMDSFLEGNQDEFLKKMKQASCEKNISTPQSTIRRDLKDVLLVAGITIMVIIEVMLMQIILIIWFVLLLEGL